MITIENITKHFGGITALDQCSFKIPADQITAVIGPNGAGKTTLFDIISALIPADSGRVHADGAELTEMLPHEVASQGIARTFQQVRLFKNLTILDHLVMAEDNEDTKLFRNLMSNSKSQIPNHKHQEYIKRFGIDRPLQTLVSDLSYGQRKLLQLALAVKRPHKLLLLDEPVAGVNKVVQAKIEQLLLELKQRGETVVIIDHDMEFIKKLADYVVVMDEGRALTEGKPERVLKDKRVLEAYLGE